MMSSKYISAMSDLAHIRRQLRIKTGVAQRLTKEYLLYIKEAEQQHAKLDKFVAAGAESWDINNATRMLEESNKMIKDTENRRDKAVEDLQDLVIRAKKETELANDDDLSKAEAVLEAASK